MSPNRPSDPDCPYCHGAGELIVTRDPDVDMECVCTWVPTIEGTEMIEEWTPTTEQVRDGYAIDPEAEHHDPIGYPQWERYARRAFDRWLAAHDAELLASARQDDWEYGCRSSSHSGFMRSVFSWEDDATWREHLAECPSPAPVRRHRATEWEPVPDTEGSDQ